MVDWTLEEIKALVGVRPLLPTFKAMPQGAVPATTADQLAQLRQLAREMHALSPQIIAGGGTVPAAAIPAIKRALDLFDRGW